jgi:hypothetical protein
MESQLIEVMILKIAGLIQQNCMSPSKSPRGSIGRNGLGFVRATRQPFDQTILNDKPTIINRAFASLVDSAADSDEIESVSVYRRRKVSSRLASSKIMKPFMRTWL